MVGAIRADYKQGIHFCCFIATLSLLAQGLILAVSASQGAHLGSTLLNSAPFLAFPFVLSLLGSFLLYIDAPRIGGPRVSPPQPFTPVPPARPHFEARDAVLGNGVRETAGPGPDTHQGHFGLAAAAAARPSHRSRSHRAEAPDPVNVIAPIMGEFNQLVGSLIDFLDAFVQAHRRFDKEPPLAGARDTIAQAVLGIMKVINYYLPQTNDPRSMARFFLTSGFYHSTSKMFQEWPLQAHTTARYFNNHARVNEIYNRGQAARQFFTGDIPTHLPTHAFLARVFFEDELEQNAWDFFGKIEQVDSTVFEKLNANFAQAKKISSQKVDPKNKAEQERIANQLEKIKDANINLLVDGITPALLGDPLYNALFSHVVKTRLESTVVKAMNIWGYSAQKVLETVFFSPDLLPKFKELTRLITMVYRGSDADLSKPDVFKAWANHVGIEIEHNSTSAQQVMFLEDERVPFPNPIQFKEIAGWVGGNSLGIARVTRAGFWAASRAGFKLFVPEFPAGETDPARQQQGREMYSHFLTLLNTLSYATYDAAVNKAEHAFRKPLWELTLANLESFSKRIHGIRDLPQLLQVTNANLREFIAALNALKPAAA